MPGTYHKVWWCKEAGSVLRTDWGVCHLNYQIWWPGTEWKKLSPMVSKVENASLRSCFTMKKSRLGLVRWDDQAQFRSSDLSCSKRTPLRSLEVYQLLHTRTSLKKTPEDTLAMYVHSSLGWVGIYKSEGIYPSKTIKTNLILWRECVPTCFCIDVYTHPAFQTQRFRLSCAFSVA